GILSAMNEWDWLKKMRHRIPHHPQLLVGVGDDAALLRNTPETLVCVDMLLDGAHFESDKDAARLVGRKALAVNLSDIAAMGGRPFACVISIAIPKNKTGIDKFLDEVYEGLTSLAAE